VSWVIRCGVSHNYVGPREKDHKQSIKQFINQRKSYVNSSLNLVELTLYSRFHNKRFTVITIALMTNVAPSSTGKFPASVARLITAPSPVIENV